MARPTLITLTTNKPKRRPPPEPNSKASSSGSNGAKRWREDSHSRSQSPAKRAREDGIIDVIRSDELDRKEDEEEIQELSEYGESEPTLEMRTVLIHI